MNRDIENFKETSEKENGGDVSKRSQNQTHDRVNRDVELYQGHMSSQRSDNNQSNNHSDSQRQDHAAMTARKRAQIMKEKVLLDDNKKNLTYMELISGSAQKDNDFNALKASSFCKRDTDQTHYANSLQKSHYIGDTSMKVYGDERLSMCDLKNQSPDAEKSLMDQHNQYLEQRQLKSSLNEYSKINSQSSQKYDEVYKVLQQEMAVLQSNIRQCQQQDQKIKKEYSGNQPLTDFTPDQQFIEKLNHMETSPFVGQQYLIGSHVSSCPMTYSKYQNDYTNGTSQFGTSLPSKEAPYDQYYQQINLKEKQNEPITPLKSLKSSLKNESTSPINQANSEELKRKSVSFNQKQHSDKTISAQYLKSSPSAANPYIQNMYNGMTDQTSHQMMGGSNIITDENLQDKSHFPPGYTAHDMTLSPEGEDDTKFGRDEIDDQHNHERMTSQFQYSRDLHNDQNLQNQEFPDNSPYQQVSYFEQIQKLRQERQAEQEQIEESELQRIKYHTNVLRNQQIMPYSDKSSGLGIGGSHRRQVRNLRHNQNSSGSISRKGNQYVGQQFLTPQRNNTKSLNSQRSMKSYQDVASYSQQIYEDKYIDYRNYLRRVSKYDLDRAQVDFKKIQQEKKKDRTLNVHIKKQEVEKDIKIKREVEIENTQQKIEVLHSIRMKQERERRDFVRQQQEKFRQALADKQQYIAPPYKSKQLQNSGLKSNSLQKSKISLNQSSNKKQMTQPPKPQPMTQKWMNEIVVESPDEKQKSLNMDPELHEKLRVNPKV